MARIRFWNHNSVYYPYVEKSIGDKADVLDVGCENGKLVIVGIAAPSSLVDWTVEALRIIPCKIGSAFHRMQSSEKLNIPTSYTVLKMSKIRKIVSAVIPKARLKYGLYYRYIFTWENKNK